MDRKTLLREIGEKLRKIRESLKYKRSEMADYISAYRTSYYKYESGDTSPQMTSLYKLGKNYDISMDWLILNKGPMYYKEKEIKKEDQVDQTPFAGILAIMGKGKDVKELLEHMEHIPLLRHEVLAFFYRFKEEYKEMVETTMKAVQESR